MLPARLMRESATVIRAALMPSRGSLEPDWTNTSTRVLKGVSVQESDGGADVNGREAGTASATIYAQSGADILRGDRVEAHGRVWTVVGEPRSMGPETGLAHTVATLREWVG